MPDLITLHRKGRAVAACGRRCYNAITSHCTCICGGLNHGVGRDHATENTRVQGPAAIKQYVDEHPHLRDTQIHFHLPPAPNKTNTMF